MWTTMSELRQELNINPNTIYQWENKGFVKPHKVALGELGERERRLYSDEPKVSIYDVFAPANYRLRWPA